MTVGIELNAMEEGISHADGKEKAREYASVKKWQDIIKRARKFDEEQRKQYAKDRRSARGDSGFSVDENVIGTNIDIIESFLYAKDPDVEALPARACKPPSIDALRDAAEEIVKSDPEAQQQIAAAFQQASLSHQQESLLAIGQGLPPPPPLSSAEFEEQMVQDRFLEMKKRYESRQRDNKTLSETMEIVVSHLWRVASLQQRARRWARSGLTVGIGVLKASWQERSQPSPETSERENDIQGLIQRAAAQRASIDDSEAGDIDALIADYQQQLETIRREPQQVVARGFVIDVVQAEDFQVPPGFTVTDHRNAPWVAHRIPTLLGDAKAHFGLSDEVMKDATRYYSRKPEMVRDASAGAAGGIQATDADAYVTTGDADAAGQDEAWVLVTEVWDQTSGVVRTLIEGVKCWAKPAWYPPKTTAFNPFFLYCSSEVDGERHPQSLVSRSTKLADEYNRMNSSLREHRKRCLPKTGFHMGQLPADQIRKIEGGVTGELVGLLPTNPNASVGDLLFPIIYPPVDMSLYDTSRIMQALDRLWGIPEALSSGASARHQTATGAEIEQSAFSTRTGGRRDILEAALADLAQYTAEVAHAKLSAEDVAKIAGPNALWPEYTGTNEVASMISVGIRIGTSGKPNTSMERDAWAALMPVLDAKIDEIAMHRNATPENVADCKERMLRVTAERANEHFDLEGIIPKPGPTPPPQMMPVSGAAPNDISQQPT
jgi:hypothetical protein